MRRTKICSTLGPASAKYEVIEELIRAGTDVFRLNFSHGSLHDHAMTISSIRKITDKLKLPIPIMQDLQGPKIRIGRVENDALHLKRGKEIILSTEHMLGTATRLWISYHNLPREVKPGDTILMDDGLIQLKVLRTGDSEVLCKIIEGGTLSSNKGVNLPGVALSIAALTKKDKVDLSFGLSQHIDIVAISFVRKADDVAEIRRILERQNSAAILISKFEKPEAVKKADAILAQSDGVIVARGDLGVEMTLAKVPVVQRQLVSACRHSGIPSIVATQMLESMRTQPRPTRAEVTDVAHAIHEGVDAVMLTAETAVGERPVQTVKMLSRIISVTERDLYKSRVEKHHLKWQQKTVSDAVADSACRAAYDLKAKAIVTLTQSGYTARMIAKHRPFAPILAFTPDPLVWRQMNLLWGVTPRLMNFSGDITAILQRIDTALRVEQFVRDGEKIIVVMGLPLPERGTTNLMTVREVGSA